METASFWPAPALASTQATLFATSSRLSLFIQIQNAAGANQSPLVAGVRNLADSEFWDFNAVDGSGKDPSKGFVRVGTNYDLWNAVCNNPKASSATSNSFL